MLSVERRAKKAEYVRQWRRKNPEAVARHAETKKARGGRYNAKAKATQKAYYEVNKAKILEHQRAYNLQRKYGISPVEFDAMLEAQGGRCAICPTSTPGANRRWNVDHDKVTGKVRMILCHKCNVGLGLFDHDVTRMQAAIDYLTKFSCEGTH